MNSENLLLIAIIIAPWFILVLIKPKLLTYVALFVSVFQLGWFSRYFEASRILNRVSLGIVGILTLRVIVDILYRNRPKFSGFTLLILKYTFFGILLVLFSSIYNNVSVLFGLYNIRYYIVGFTLYFAIYLYFDKDLTIQQFKKTVVLVALVQIPVAIIKYIVAEGGEAQTLDSVTGTFASYGELNACQITATLFVLYDKLFSKVNTFRINSYLLVALLTVPLLLSQSRTATGFVLISVIFSLYLATIRSRNTILTVKNILLTAILSIGVFFLFYRFFWENRYDIREQINPTHIQDYFMRESETRMGMGRWRAISTSVDLVLSNPGNALLGYGSGAVSDAALIGMHGSFYQEYGQYAGLGANQISTNIMEFGMFGAVLALLLVLRIRSIIRSMRGVTYKIAMDTYIMLLFSLVMLSWYTITIGSYFFSILFGSFFAVCQIELDRMRLKGINSG